MRSGVHEGLVFGEVLLEFCDDSDEVDLPEQVEIHAEEVSVVAVHVQVPLRQRDVPNAQLAPLPFAHSLTAERDVASEEKGQLFLDGERNTSRARMVLRSMQ